MRAKRICGTARKQPKRYFILYDIHDIYDILHDKIHEERKWISHELTKKNKMR